MSKKSISTSILVIFLAILFAVIGSSFSFFVYKDTKIEIKKVSLATASSISFYADEELENEISELNLSKMELGLKPATGEIDGETEIPSTITTDGTSEGYYASVYVSSSSSYKIYAENVEIKTNGDFEKATKERKNIFVAIKDVNSLTKSLELDSTEIATINFSAEPAKLTFVFWLSSISGEELKGAKISLTLKFTAI